MGEPGLGDRLGLLDRLVDRGHHLELDARSRPTVPVTVSWMSPRNRDSTRSLIRVLGTPRTISLSLMDSGVIPDR